MLASEVDAIFGSLAKFVGDPDLLEMAGILPECDGRDQPGDNGKGDDNDAMTGKGLGPKHLSIV